MNILWWRKHKLNNFTLTIKFDKLLPNGKGTFNTGEKIITLSINDELAESILAHELGHLMSMVLRTPIAKKVEVIDSLGNILGLSGQYYDRERIEEEEEAWKFARMIFPGRINEEFAKKCLKSYGKKD